MAYITLGNLSVAISFAFQWAYESGIFDDIFLTSFMCFIFVVLVDNAFFKFNRRFHFQ